MSSAIQQEYEEGVQALGGPRMQFYKVLSLFSFENGNEIHFGEGMASYSNDRQHYDQLKDYIKEQKRWVRATDVPVTNEIRMRLWWLQSKMIEFGIFSPSEQRSIFPFMMIL